MAVHTVSSDERILAMVLAPFPKTRAALVDVAKAFVTAHGLEPKMMHMPPQMMKVLKTWSADEWGSQELKDKVGATGKLPDALLGMDVVFSAPFFALYAPNPNYVPPERAERPNARERALARRRG